MKTHRWLWMLAALAILAGYGCVDDDAGPTIITDRGAIQVNLDFVTRAFPGGEVDNDATVLELDTINSPTDVLGRSAPSRDPVFVQSGDLDVDATTDWIGPRYWFDDPRLPTLIEHTWADDYDANVDWLEFQRPDRASRIDRWDYRSDLDYVAGWDSMYALGLARYATVVNGLVDHLEILVNDGEVTEPDELVLLGGAPGGYPEHQADFWVFSDPPDDYCPPMVAGANPFILGHFKTGPTVDPKDAGANFDGETDADFCFLGSGLWQSGYENDLHPDSIPFAPNNFETFDLPQYNYLVVWEYDPATNTIFWDRPHMRAQVGVELDTNGDPIPHTFAPFPTAPGRELSEFGSFGDFLAHPNVMGGTKEITLYVFNLSPLQSGYEYQVWLFDDVESTAARIEFTYTQQSPDTVGFDELGEPIIEWNDVIAPNLTQGFDGGAEGYRHVIYTSNDATGDAGVDLNTYSHIVITIGSDDANPNDSPAPTFYRFTDLNGTREDKYDNAPVLDVAETTFGFLPEYAAEDRSWKAFGGGLAQFLNVEAISLTLDRMARPPLGYYYAVWIRDNVTGDYYGLGEITTPPPEQASLFDADIETGEWVTQGEIFEAIKYALWEDVPARFDKCYDTTAPGGGEALTQPCTLVVTLEPKAGDHSVMSETVMFVGSIPKDLNRISKEEELR